MKFYFLIVITIMLYTIPALAGAIQISDLGQLGPKGWITGTNDTIEFSFVYSGDKKTLTYDLYLDDENESSGSVNLTLPDYSCDHDFPPCPQPTVSGKIYSNRTISEGEHTWHVIGHTDNYSVSSGWNNLCSNNGFVLDNTPPTIEWKNSNVTIQENTTVDMKSMLSVSDTVSSWRDVTVILMDENRTVRADTKYGNGIVWNCFQGIVQYPLPYGSGWLNTSNSKYGDKFIIDIIVTDMAGNVAYLNNTTGTIGKANILENGMSSVIHGYILDYYKKPLHNLTVAINVGNFTMQTRTNERGEYSFTNMPYPHEYNMTVPLQDSFVDIRNFNDSATFVYESSVNVNTPSVEHNITLTNTPLAEASVIYYYIKQAQSFFTNALTFVFDHEMPEDVYIFGNGGTFHSTNPDMIEINAQDSAVNSTNMPDNRERHEFSHHVMYDAYEMMPPECGGVFNHRGWNNPSTSDSWCEGFAEFTPLVISDYSNETNPWMYSAGDGIDLEANWRAGDGWPFYGSAEELAVASLLWDFYDSDATYAAYNNRHDDDNVSITMNEMWSIMSASHNLTVHYDGDPENRYIYYVNDLYDALSSANVTDQENIDDVFEAHGFPNGQPDVPLQTGRH